MDIEQLKKWRKEQVECFIKKWCKEQAEYYEGEMSRAIGSCDEEYYKYCDGMQYAYWSVYHKIEAEEHKIENAIV